ncbi:MAG: hypothetical protein QHJ73_20105, partial [Armatimonadota bacterium]|nr:hypothetical protein [Armatimonadota bacterium]
MAISLDTGPMDGTRRLAVVVDPDNALSELSEGNNRLERVVQVQPDWSRWRGRKRLRVNAGAVEREDEPILASFALPAKADPSSLRVVETDAKGNPLRSVPAQLDGSTLCAVLPGKTPAGAERHLAVLWAEGSGARFLPVGAPAWNAATQTVVMEGYEARFSSGSLTFLAPRHNGVTGANFLASLILSSQATGWSSEDGKVELFQVERAGPVRVTIAVRKALGAGVTYQKRYDFFPRRFDLEIAVNKPAGGLYSRAHYLLPGTYLDDKGFTARVDGKGEAEEVYGKNRDPKWYAVFAPQWAHSCVALSPFDHIAYWDAGQLGAIGFVADNRTEGIRMSYVIHPGASDGSFAARD